MLPNQPKTTYFIPIPKDPEAKHRLDGLLNGLEPYYRMEVIDCLQVVSPHPTLDPILRKLASHTIDPEQVEEPVKEQVHPYRKSYPSRRDNGRKHSAPRIYTLPDGKKITMATMDNLLLDEKIQAGEIVKHSRLGEMRVECQDGQLVLTKVDGDEQSD